ncbi:MAG: hypothetical protein HQL97_00260 [Magnetococcales bacterium]|nr:hypothetical protein [Magnetococcales bacterium]
MKLITRRGEPFEYFEETERLDLFSVSQGRKEAFNSFRGVQPDILEAARVRGTILHKRFFFAMAHCAGLCEYPKRIELYGGYCDSMDRWIDEAKPKPVKLEAAGLNRRYLYAGTRDADILYMGSDLTIMDLKSGVPTCTDEMQLIAYDHMDGCKAERHLDVYLDKNGGRAKEAWVERSEMAAHWAGFLNALSMLRWRMKYGR